MEIHYHAKRLTHQGRDKMAAIFQTTFSNAFSWMEMHEFDEDFTEAVPNGPINNISALVQIMAWHRPGDKPQSEPMIVYWRIYAPLGLNAITGKVLYIHSLWSNNVIWRHGWWSSLDQIMDCRFFQGSHGSWKIIKIQICFKIME